MLINNQNYITIWYDKKEDTIKVIDQNHLPFKLKIISLNNLNDVVKAIKLMKVRGAPLIGATAAFGLYLAFKEKKTKESLIEAYRKLKQTRPTAINLFWALDRVLSKINLTKISSDTEELLLNEALKICKEDIENCKKIARNGYKIIKEIMKKNKKNKINILTHCNAGWLATIDWGTATSPIYYAKKKEIDLHVWVDETRPRNQGALLTSFELNNEGISNTIIVDNAGGFLMKNGQVDLCLVGADRVTKTGHVANKIGTYLKALAAKDNNIPFYVAIPTSSIDWKIRNYEDITIEERDQNELYNIRGLSSKNKIVEVQIFPKENKIYNPSFDITPNSFITGIITEKKIVKANEKDLKTLKND